MSAECRTQYGYRCLFPFYESAFHVTLHRRCLSGSGGSWCATSYCPGLYNFCSWDYCRIPFCSEGKKIYQVEKYVSNILWIISHDSISNLHSVFYHILWKDVSVANFGAVMTDVLPIIWDVTELGIVVMTNLTVQVNKSILSKVVRIKKHGINCSISCIVVIAGRPCQWSSWREGYCDQTCGGGIRRDTRTKLVRELYGGMCPGQAFRIVNCNPQQCPKSNSSL